MSDLLEFAGANRLSDTWGALREFEFLKNVPTANLEFWWKADDITTADDGDAITTLTNIAGTGDPTQSTLANRALYRAGVINGKPALEFDGVNDYYIANGPQSAFSGDDLPITAYAVFKADVTATTIYYMSMGRSTTTNTSLRFGHISSGVYRATKLADAGGIVNRNGGTTKTTPVLRVDLSTGTTYSLWENETNEVSSGNFDVGAQTLNRFVVGANYQQGSLADYFEGLIAEVLVYSTNHSDTTRLLITRYLKNKYRLYV